MSVAEGRKIKKKHQRIISTAEHHVLLIVSLQRGYLFSELFHHLTFYSNLIQIQLDVLDTYHDGVWAAQKEHRYYISI